VEEAVSPSTAKSTEVSARCSMICTIMLGQGNRQKPNYLGKNIGIFLLSNGISEILCNKK
jgi:hypothetical protein